MESILQGHNPQENLLPEKESLHKKEIGLEIPPETEKTVIKKIQDINEVGTAYTKIVGMGASSLNMDLHEKIASIFRLGVISPLWLIDILNKEKPDKGYNTVFPDNINLHHKGKRGFIFFNIVGKTSKSRIDQHFDEDENEIDRVHDKWV